MRPARFFEDNGACGDVPERERGQAGRENRKQTLNTFMETTKPQNLTDMDCASSSYLTILKIIFTLNHPP